MRTFRFETGRSVTEVLPSVHEALLSDDFLLQHYAVETLKGMPLREDELQGLVPFAGDLQLSWPFRMALLDIIKRSDPNFEPKPSPDFTPRR